LPFFPDDELSYLAGISGMGFVPFLLANIFGHVGGSWSLAYVGAGVESYDWFFWLIVVCTMFGFGLVFWRWHKGGQKSDS
jgi:uncharacterized membrane protein YdjX (TVP38/TMEM64 family)